MAVVEQYPYVNTEGKEDYGRVKHYSDGGKMIVQRETGCIYEEAVDVCPCPFTYEELSDEREGEPDERGNTDLN